MNPVYTTGIEGLSDDEARSMLARLVQHSVHPNFTCRIRWQPHQLVIWDNRCTQHFAINDYPAETRIMHRVTICGDTPF